MPKKTKNELSPTQREELLCVLKIRFEKNMNRHKGIEWTKVKAKFPGLKLIMGSNCPPDRLNTANDAWISI